ncbi:hypothetical protein L5515_013262 [Caenorhabditis briggsae]|uniref:Uncharacterized protein n=1 Tax=Caenorhabditis briggsae TaxID=6238 RepID=A0AAE9E7P6_CAEBR|nr:hypothetical protein L5515_013262 [Caenorhabditis briggsae]
MMQVTIGHYGVMNRKTRMTEVLKKLIKYTVCFIASIFIQNNVSRNLAIDIFTISDLLKENPSVKLIDINKKMEEWKAFDSRVYAFCVQCDSILNPSKKCANRVCSRFSISQSNVSQLKSIVSFSIRKQVEELIQNGCFDSSLLKRTQCASSLSQRLCNTLNYQERIQKSEKEHPNVITVFFSINVDGFRKRGSSRGEYWPVFLALHDVTWGEGTFREYNPHMMILAAIMQTNKKLWPTDFYLVDHLAKRIRKHGSPLLSSAAPYERLNQTLGRSSNNYTTRTMINVSSRFMALKRATFSCLAIVENWNSDLKMPATMQALGKHLNDAPNTENIDDCPLEKKEEEYLNRYMKNKPVFRSSWSNGRKQFSVRRKCSDRLVHNCYIYYFNKNMDVEFGSIERIFIDEKDRFMILLQRFETRTPFDYLTTNLSNFAQWHNLKIDWNSSNTFFRQITENTNIFRASENKNPIFNNPEEAQQKYPNFKPYDVTPLVDKVVSSDESSNNSVEMDDRNESDSMDNARNVHQMSNSSFSLSQHLGKNVKEEPPIERLEAAIKTGNPLSIGQVLREGFSKKTLTEVQVEEMCRSVPKPAISLLQFYNDYEQSTPGDRAAIPIGQLLLTKIAMLESRSVDKLQASVNSLASSFVQHTKVAMLVKRTLLRTHTTEATDNFPKIELSAAYARTNLIGDNGFSQMTYFLTKLFSNLLTPNYAIWKYTYRPRCIRPADKHFELFPKQIADKLIDFAFDCIGIYLPDDLLHGPIDPSHPFLDELDDDCDATKEVERRRAERELVSQTMQSAIGHILNYIRDYHLDIRTGSLESCKNRKTCEYHLSWKDVKIFREKCRAENKNPDDFEPADLIGL